MSTTDLTDEERREASVAQATAYLQLLQAQDWDKWIELWGQDAVLEFPYAPRGRPRTYRGREEILRYMSGTTESIAVDGVTALRLHSLQDPNTVIAELEIQGHLLANNEPYNQIYVTVFEFKDGRIEHYREYWNPLVSIDAHGGYDQWIAAFEDRAGR